MGVAHVLARCGTVDAADVLDPLCRCFQGLLGHSHSWFVRTEALEAFRQFAEQTHHPKSLEQCVPESMNSIVVDYLQKVFGEKLFCALIKV